MNQQRSNDDRGNFVRYPHHDYHLRSCMSQNSDAHLAYMPDCLLTDAKLFLDLET